jgi:DNA-directed RNA polymerase specialized sigma24 family protein
MGSEAMATQAHAADALRTCLNASPFVGSETGPQRPPCRGRRAVGVRPSHLAIRAPKSGAGGRAPMTPSLLADCFSNLIGQMAAPETDLFATTRWTLVIAASGTDEAAKEKALADLCAAYWRPIFAYIRRRGHGVEQAKDLTQEFLGRVLERDWLAGLTREGSKFRAFLLVAVKRFLAVEYERQSAQKRGGGAIALSLDSADIMEPASPDETPERAYDRRWALTVIDRAAERLRAEASASGRTALFARVAGYLSGDPEPGAYEGAAHELGMSRAAVAMTVHRLRLRLREHIRAEIGDTTSSTREIEGEMRDLMSALRG